MPSRRFFYAQAYMTAGRGVAPGRLQQCYSAEEAVSAAEHMAEKAAGAAAYSIEGDPQFGVWGDPVAIVRFGRAGAMPASEALR